MIDGPPPARHPPVLIRLLALAVGIAIAYVSLHPLADWRLRQPSAFAFLSQGLPRFYSQADIVSNIAAYVILGVLVALGWYPRRRGWLAVSLAATVGLALSLTMETLQSYLPARVPTLLDVAANVGGAALGGVLGALVARFRRHGRIAGRLPASLQWHEQGLAIGWVLLVIWLVTQLPTQRLLFSTGHLQAWLSATFPALAQALPGFASEPGEVGRLGALVPEALRSVHESLAIATMVCIVGVLVMDLVQSAGWRLAWITGLLAVALGLRVAFSPRFETARRLAVWFTSGAQAGVLLAALALYLIGAFGRRSRLAVGMALVLLGLALVNVAPIDPFFETSLASGPAAQAPGLTPSLRSLIAALGAFWPMLALAYFAIRWGATRRRR
ncbi:MAG: VanZ family protein [Burkholderiaceae bacterium]|nr:VanZ family protein [Burkholderiaceae bacterium]